MASRFSLVRAEMHQAEVAAQCAVSDSYQHHHDIPALTC
jgi:hypothetical protein